MGLDITAYSKLSYIGDHEIDPARNEGEPGPWCMYEDHVQAYAYESFPQSFRGIPILGNRDRFILGGCYEETAETKTHGFRAGSYSGYNRWRAELQEQFNPEREPEQPFYELIWFADNEGTIGPEAAADLLADFRAYARRINFTYDWFAEVYADWTKAFELAADGGVVDFH